MKEYDEITHNNLPEAMMLLIQKVDYIMNHFMNEAAITSEPTPSIPEKELLTVYDVSQMLSLSKGTIYNMTSARQIPFMKKGKRIYFDKLEILEWIKEDRQKTIKQLQAEAKLELRK